VYALLLLFGCSCAKREKLLIGGAGWPQIAIIDKASGKMEWQHPLAPEEECNDVEITPQGEILYAGKQTARLITRDHREVWTYAVQSPEAVYTATRLPSGNYMLCIAGWPARIVEVDRTGTVQKEASLHIPSRSVEGQFRQIFKTPDSTYLIPLYEKHKVSEVSEDGTKVLRSFYCGGLPYSVKLADNGNWIVSTGAGRSIVEFAPQLKTIVRTIETKGLSYGAVVYAGEAIRYRNGNTLVANWNGESADKSQPCLFEVDSTNRVVWRLYHPEISNISTVYSFFE
jgi:hypothetical protein